MLGWMVLLCSMCLPSSWWVNVSGYALLMLLPGPQNSIFFQAIRHAAHTTIRLAKVSDMALPKIKKQEQTLNPFNGRNDKHKWEISWIVVRVKIWGHKENILLSKGSPSAQSWHNAQSSFHFQYLGMSLSALDNFLVSFMHLLRWSYDFYLSFCECDISVIELHVLDHPCILGMNITWPCNMILFVLLSLFLFILLRTFVSLFSNFWKF